MTEAHYANGTAISDYAVVQSFTLTAPNLAGEDDDVAGRVGLVEGVWVPKDADYQLGLLMLGREASGQLTRARYLENARSLRRLLFNDAQPFTYRRTLDLSSGAQDVEGPARYVSGLDVAQVAAHAGRAMVRLSLLDGFLYDRADTTVNPGTVTVAGDARTRRMTLTLPGAGTLTNSTLGVSVTVSGATTLDVEAFTSSGGVGLVTGQSGSDYWFEFAVGPNIVTWSGSDTPSIAYRAAHLP